MGKKKIITKSEESREETKTSQTPPAVSKKILEDGKVFIYINATYNNTMLSAANGKGDVITWVSAGSLGFSGPKRSTPFAAAKVAETIVEKIKDLKPREVEIRVKGVGSGRDSAIRTIANRGLNVSAIRDMTPIPHNGPRPPKVRRL